MGSDICLNLVDIHSPNSILGAWFSHISGYHKLQKEHSILGPKAFLQRIFTSK